MAASKQPDSYSTALAEKRLEVLKQINEQLANPQSLVSQTVAAYQAVIDGTYEHDLQTKPPAEVQDLRQICRML